MPLATEVHGTPQTNIPDDVVAQLRMGSAARQLPASEVAILTREAYRVRPVRLKFDGHDMPLSAFGFDSTQHYSGR